MQEIDMSRIYIKSRDPAIFHEPFRAENEPAKKKGFIKCQGKPT